MSEGGLKSMRITQRDGCRLIELNSGGEFPRFFRGSNYLLGKLRIMKLTLTESQLRDFVKRGIKEAWDAITSDKDVRRHFGTQSEIAMKIKRMCNSLEWGLGAYGELRDDFVFVLGKNGGGSGDASQICDYLTKVFGADCQVKQEGNVVVVSVKKAYNRDFKKSKDFVDSLGGEPLESPAAIPSGVK